MSLNEKEISAVSALSRDERLGYFIKRAADFERVWGIDEAGWVLSALNDGRSVFQLWPFADYAALCCVGEWASCAPKAIDLDDFMESFLADFEESGMLIGIFYTPHDAGAILTASELRGFLEDELEKY